MHLKATIWRHILVLQQDIIVYLLLILVSLSNYILFYTSPDLTLRAVGEYPRAADTAGVLVQRVRYFAVVISGV